jgi:hypothetical protein
VFLLRVIVSKKLGIGMGFLALLLLLAAPSAAQTGSLIKLEQLASGLDNPVAITHAGDGTGRLFITEQTGKIRLYKPATGLAGTAFLDISSLVETVGEQGLLSVAFHPSFETNGRFFVYYTNKSGDNVVASYTASPANADTVSTSTAQIILTISHPTYGNHNGGQLQFGPDGYLYLATGDGGSDGDPNNNGQNINSLLGKLLRLDISVSPYAIPASNPFVGKAGDDRIWAYGLRNPWRFSFDRANGDMFIGDVGQSSWEEINHKPSGVAGANYGWRLMEGAHCFNPATNCDPGGLTYPILEYPNGGEECSVTGGYRYRGTQEPTLGGIYVYGDFCSGRIWGGIQSGSWSSNLLFDSALLISTFGEDESGELYVADRRDAPNGGLYRIRAERRIVNTAGYVLDRFGGLHPYREGTSNAANISNGPYWPGQDVARGVALRSSTGGYVLDAYGAIHSFGTAPHITATAYWLGWDIARGVAVNPDVNGGYVLDGFGGLHPFGNAVKVTNGPYWNGFDIARGVVLTPGSTAANPKGYVLDGFGGVHPFGSAPGATASAYWGGWDIARGITSNSAGTGGYTLDGWGGVHAFGTSSSAVKISSYWSGWDIARGLTALGDGTGGFVLDGFGGLHAFTVGTNLLPQNPTISGYWPNWDISLDVT